MPATPTLLDDPRGSTQVRSAAEPTFSELGVPRWLAERLARRGIAAPFPIQAATIPDALAGRDVSGRAPTGSGKTIAFGIPMVVGVSRANPRKPRGLVLVPTRELASQVCSELRQLAGPKGPSIEAFYGGVGFQRQIDALRKGVDVAVCCPGRLADLIGQGLVSLGEVDLVVVDEADRMADMGFLPEVKRLLDSCARDRQTLLFSATLDGAVDVLVKRYQRDPVRHEHVVEEEDLSRATHEFWSVDRAERIPTAAALISRNGATVVFCRTKRGADRVARQLEGAGVSAVAIHGGRSQGQRERALKSFDDGHVAALVATDVAARGIHVDGVSCVVHFDPPGEAKDYVHRSGRTARAGASGMVVSLVPNELRNEVRKLQRELGYPLGFTEADLEAIGPVIVRTKPKPSSSGSNGSGSNGSRSNGSRSNGARSNGSGRSTRPAAKAQAGQKAHSGRRKRPQKSSARSRG